MKLSSPPSATIIVLLFDKALAYKNLVSPKFWLFKCQDRQVGILTSQSGHLAINLFICSIVNKVGPVSLPDDVALSCKMAQCQNLQNLVWKQNYGNFKRRMNTIWKQFLCQLTDKDSALASVTMCFMLHVADEYFNGFIIKVKQDINTADHFVHLPLAVMQSRFKASVILLQLILDSTWKLLDTLSVPYSSNMFTIHLCYCHLIFLFLERLLLWSVSIHTTFTASVSLRTPLLLSLRLCLHYDSWYWAIYCK